MTQAGQLPGAGSPGQQQWALVTGAASGIGAATAHRLAAGGTCVYCTDIDLDAAETVARQIGQARA